jgi:glucose dehydrogenase
VKHAFVLGPVLVALWASVAQPAQAADGPFDTWRQYLGGADSSQYSSLKQVNKTNVNKLQVAWTYPAGPGNLLFNPIVVDGTMSLSPIETWSWRWTRRRVKKSGLIPTRE